MTDNEVNDCEENYITGYISLFRSFTKWEWFTEPNMVTVFIYCLLKANFKNNKWKGIEVKKGSFITSYNSISEDTGLSIQKVRTCLNKLIKTGELTSKSTNKNTVITVVKYSVYQQTTSTTNTQLNKQITNKQQTTNIQLTTDNKDNNINKENNTILTPEDKPSDVGKEKIKPEDYFIKIFNETKGTKENPTKYRLNDKIIKQLKDRIKEKYTSEDFVTAIKNCKKDKFHIEKGLKHLTPEYITRASALELHLNGGQESKSKWAVGSI